MWQGVDVKLEIVQCPDSFPSLRTLPPVTPDYSQMYVLSFGAPSSLPLWMNWPSFFFSRLEIVIGDIVKAELPYFDLILLLQHRLFPMLLKTVCERFASRLALRGTRAFPLLVELETEATIRLLTKLNYCRSNDVVDWETMTPPGRHVSDGKIYFRKEEYR